MARVILGRGFRVILVSFYLCLSVVSLRVSLEALCIDADGGPRPSTAPTHPKHQAGSIREDDP